jgi:hypothetical protein
MRSDTAAGSPERDARRASRSKSASMYHDGDIFVTAVDSAVPFFIADSSFRRFYSAFVGWGPHAWCRGLANGRGGIRHVCTYGLVEGFGLGSWGGPPEKREGPCGGQNINIRSNCSPQRAIPWAAHAGPAT